jgi:hypothetical protein
LYSIAEQARHGIGADVPAAGIEPQGGDSPEGAIDVLLDGVEALDLRQIIAAINPDEAEALQRYAPIFLDDAQAELDAELDSVGFQWEVTDVAYTVEGSGSRRFVTIDSLQIVGTADGSEFSVEIDGSCYTARSGGEEISNCGLTGQGDFDDLLGDQPAIQEFIDVLNDALADYEAPGITVQEVDGQWYISPIGSGADQVLALLRAFDREEIDALIEAGTAVVDEFFADFGGWFAYDDDYASDELFDEELFDEGFDVDGPFIGEDTLDEVFGDGVFGDEVFGDDVFGDDVFGDDVPGEQPADDFDDRTDEILEECYALTDAASVAACLQDAIDRGELDPVFLSAELKYPECGVADFVVDTVNTFELSDEEYTAIVVAANDCFRKLIDSGVIGEFDVDPEYLKPECAAGRNPWGFEASDADEFFEIWLDCIYG